MDVAQPIWLTGCYFSAKHTKNAFLALKKVYYIPENGWPNTLEIV